MEKTVPVKITRPGISRVVPRKRLFSLLDAKMESPVIWVSSAAGSGKTMLVASYLDARRLPCLWYQCDEGDADLATFFYYLGMAAKKAAPRRRIALPLLTPEYLQGIPTFTRRYFERLYALLTARPASPKKPPIPPVFTKEHNGGFFIVLDNYQDVPADSPFHDMIAGGFDIIPEGVHIVVISRTDPPAVFARLQANGRIGLLEYSDLRFTFEEAAELVHGRIPDMSREGMRAVYEKAEGWAAGIVLMLERFRLEGANILSDTYVAYGFMFDYFAGEIFRKTERYIQQFLLKTAFLPSLDIAGAERLTGEHHAETILAGLARHNFFTERLSGSGDNYRYHPLFRDYLTKQAKATFGPGELSALRMKAAQIEEETGNIEDAARLYGDAGELGQLARIVINYARHFLMQGRNKTVAEWLAAIPQATIADNPWLLYWLGLCSFPADMIHTRSCMEKALTAFRSANDPAGLYLAWAGVVDSYSHNLGTWDDLDECIEVFDDLQSKYPFPASAEIELIASSRILILLILRRMENAGPILHWFDRISRLLNNSFFADIYQSASFYMSTYYLWKGEYNSNALLLEQAVARFGEKSSPLSMISVRLMMGIHYWVTAQYEAAVEHLTAGLALAEESGVYHYNSLLWSFIAAVKIATGNKTEAEETLQKQKEAALRTSGTLDMFFSHINSAWQALLNEDAQLAAMHMEAIAAPAAQMGHPYYRALWLIGMAQVLYLQERSGEAQTTISQALQIGRYMKSAVIEWYSLLVASWFFFGQGSENEGLEALRRALALGRKHGYVHLEFYQPAVMRFLCAKALAQGMEEDYCRSLIKKLGLTPPVSGPAGGHALMPELNHWPYPVRICTLGRFMVFRDNWELGDAGKLQKKPLEMLKALIAAGGADVSAMRLAEELWPDAEGDLARISFEVTLSRLRRLFVKDIILYNAGELSINQGCCQVDSLVLAGMIDQAVKAPPERIGGLCDQALSLYQGHFLPDDTALAWSVHRREKLKNGLLQIILKAGRHSEQAGGWEEAAGYYEAGLNVDPLTEEFYQRLMSCYGKLGRTAAAVKAYQRCSEILFKHLGIKPSPETRAIYSSLLEQT